MRLGIVGIFVIGMVSFGCQWVGDLDELSIGTGGSGGTGGQNSSGVPSSMSGWFSGTEDCLNGKDDDLNGAIDCADTACSMVGFTCAPGIPPGWQFVAAMMSQFAPDAPSLTCPDGQPTTRVYAEPATTGTCSACNCSYDGVTCGAPEVSCWYTNTSCSGGADIKIPAQAAGCSDMSNVPLVGTPGSCLLTGPPVPTNKGTCTATGGTLEGPPTWGKAIDLCGVPSFAGGCEVNQACIPNMGVGLMNSVQCIMKEGTNACPLDWSATKIEAFQNGVDTRECVGCACDVNTATCSGGIAWVYDEPNCAGSNVPIQFDSGCTVAQTQFDQGRASVAGMAGSFASGSCGNGKVQGSVNAINPVTLCCH
jgi:hypothetical protein